MLIVVSAVVALPPAIVKLELPVPVLVAGEARCVHAREITAGRAVQQPGAESDRAGN